MNDTMVLRPLTADAPPRKFGTYDFEWVPDTMKLRLCGLYDGDRYFAYRSIDEFMEAILTEEYAGTWFFAHAGGIADFVFLLEWFVGNPDGYEIEARFSGSAAVYVEVKRDRNTWIFVDSYFLLRAKLRDIAKSIGEEKGGEDGSKAMFYAPWAELAEYNEKDCTILWKAIHQLQEILLSLGGELMPTIASCAMRLFRRRYLSRPILTNPARNLELRDAYVASRVEVFKKEAHNVKQYDINSSFPFSMTKPAPGNVVGCSKRIDDRLDDLFFALATIEVPDQEIPPLPYRSGGKVWYPTGSWRSWFSGADLRLLERTGGRILKVEKAYFFEPRTDLAEYVDDVYSQRLKASGFMKDVLKILLNGIYGKWGERTEKTKILINPPDRSSQLRKVKSDGTPAAIELMPGIIAVSEERDIAHEHVPFAATFTARSRELLHNYIVWAQDCAYCDTDCIVTAKTMPGVAVANDFGGAFFVETNDKRLGAMKLEKEHIEHGEYFAPKFYAQDGKVKAKGFPKLTEEGFGLLVGGWTGHFERMARPREMLRKGDSEPKLLHVPKALRFGMDKRKFSSPTSSWPWTKAEIDQMVEEA